MGETKQDEKEEKLSKDRGGKTFEKREMWQ